MDKLSVDQMIEKALEEALKGIREKRFQEALKETREVCEENNKEEKEKLVITIDDEGVLIDGMGDQATLLNGVNALCELLKQSYKMDLHEVFMAMEFANKFEAFKSKLEQ